METPAAQPPSASSTSPCTLRRRRRSRACAYVSAVLTASSVPMSSRRTAYSVLIRISYEQGYGDEGDYFVYNAGAAAADPPRPPSLLLLPPYYVPRKQLDLYSSGPGDLVQHDLDDNSTGLLRRGEDELVVAELTVVANKDTPRQKVAELLLLRSGKWSTMRPLISHGDGKAGERLPSSWTTTTTVAVGDRLLCWADSSRGLLLCEVYDDDPVLRYVPLPVEGLRRSPSTGTDRAATCASRPVARNCRHSYRAYTINAWTLRMDDMVWVMDGMVDSTELWAQDAYEEHVPRVQLDDPIVSLDDPNIIYFVMCECYHVKRGDMTEWLVVVDMRSKTLLSVLRYPEGQHHFRGSPPIPIGISDYFNSYPSCNNGKSSKRKRDIDMEPPVVANVKQKLTHNDRNPPLMQSSWMPSMKPMEASTKVLASPEETILATLEEIPGLALEDMLKAYSLLRASPRVVGDVDLEEGQCGVEVRDATGGGIGEDRVHLSERGSERRVLDFTKDKLGEAVPETAPPACHQAGPSGGAGAAEAVEDQQQQVVGQATGVVHAVGEAPETGGSTTPSAAAACVPVPAAASGRRQPLRRPSRRPSSRPCRCTSSPRASASRTGRRAAAAPGAA
ncbi:hypothetical protein ACP70R_004011 [Stipagrostis hirtigluma subsp. patula]